MSAAAAKTWRPMTEAEALEVDQLLRDLRTDVGTIQGHIGRLQGATDALAKRQDQHEAKTASLDEKIDRVLANQERFEQRTKTWVTAAKLVWAGVAVLAVVANWIWDHVSLFR